MNRYWVIALLPLFLQCKDKIEKTRLPETNAAEQHTYLPIKDLLKEDLRNADSTYTSILLKTIVGRSRDSVYIPIERFRAWTDSILPVALDAPVFETAFRETSLKDETTGLFQFIYEDTAGKTDLAKAIVYVLAGTANDKVTRVYLEAGRAAPPLYNDRKIIWNLGRYILVADRIQQKDGAESIRITKMIWDPAYFKED